MLLVKVKELFSKKNYVIGYIFGFSLYISVAKQLLRTCHYHKNDCFMQPKPTSQPSLPGAFPGLHFFPTGLLNPLDTIIIYRRRPALAAGMCCIT
jgi:hypothetical protein